MYLHLFGISIATSQVRVYREPFITVRAYTKPQNLSLVRTIPKHYRDIGVAGGRRHRRPILFDLSIATSWISPRDNGSVTSLRCEKYHPFNFIRTSQIFTLPMLMCSMDSGHYTTQYLTQYSLLYYDNIMQIIWLNTQ